MSQNAASEACPKGASLPSLYDYQRLKTYIDLPPTGTCRNRRNSLDFRNLCLGLGLSSYELYALMPFMVDKVVFWSSTVSQDGADSATFYGSTDHHVIYYATAGQIDWTARFHPGGWATCVRNSQVTREVFYPKEFVGDWTLARGNKDGPYNRGLDSFLLNGDGSCLFRASSFWPFHADVMLPACWRIEFNQLIFDFIDGEFDFVAVFNASNATTVKTVEGQGHIDLSHVAYWTATQGTPPKLQ